MKQKIILYITALIILMQGASSCSDVLDVMPEGQHTLDEIFSDPVTTGAYFNSCYADMPKLAFEYTFRTSFPILASDDAWDFGSNPWGANESYKGWSNSWAFFPNWDHGIYLKDGSDRSLWKLIYRNVKRINVFIDRLQQPETVLPDDVTAGEWIAEAKVLRAFYYQFLMARIGGVCILHEGNMNDPEESLVRSTYAECARWIIDQCDEAIEDPNFPWRRNNSNDRLRPTKSLACAIKSRVALYMSSPLFNGGSPDWDYTYDVCKSSLTSLEQNGFQLYTQVQNSNLYGENAFWEYGTLSADYSDNPTDKETIYEARHNQNGNNVGKWCGIPVSNISSSKMHPTQELVDCFPMKDGSYILDLANPYADEKHLQPNYAENSSYDPQNPYIDRDPRFEALVYHDGSQITNSKKKWIRLNAYYSGSAGLHPWNGKRTQTGYYMKKYRQADMNSSNRWKKRFASYRLFGMAEMYLNVAEAAIESNNLGEAQTNLNIIRDRVGMPSIIASSQEDFRLQYKNERRIELAYTDARYDDMRRWHNPGEDLIEAKYVTGMWIQYSGEQKKGVPIAGHPTADELTYMRFVVGDTYDPASNSWSGLGVERMIWESKYLLAPMYLEEANRLRQITGDNWQNPGWD